MVQKLCWNVQVMRCVRGYMEGVLRGREHVPLSTACIHACMGIFGGLFRPRTGVSTFGTRVGKFGPGGMGMLYISGNCMKRAFYLI